MSNTLTLFHVPPQREFKAEGELAKAKIHCVLPRETITRQAKGRKPVTRTVPILRSYIAAPRKPHDAKHIGRPIGPVSEAALIRCQTDMDRRQRESQPAPLAIDDVVSFSIGGVTDMIGRLTRKRGRRQWMVLSGDREFCVQSTSLIRVDPG